VTASVDDGVNPLTAPFWAAAASGQLVVQRCTECGHAQWTPQPACVQCLSEALQWLPCSGAGVLYSATVVHRSPDPERYPAPYTVAVVTLAEGPSLLTRLRPGPREQVQFGAPVHVVFVEANGQIAYEFEVDAP
jgi:uncharacterized OB-fold protein